MEKCHNYFLKNSINLRIVQSFSMQFYVNRFFCCISLKKFCFICNFQIMTIIFMFSGLFIFHQRIVRGMPSINAIKLDLTMWKLSQVALFETIKSQIYFQICFSREVPKRPSSLMMKHQSKMMYHVMYILALDGAREPPTQF